MATAAAAGAGVAAGQQLQQQQEVPQASPVLQHSEVLLATSERELGHADCSHTCKAALLLWPPARRCTPTAHAGATTLLSAARLPCRLWQRRPVGRLPAAGGCAAAGAPTGHRRRRC